MHVKEYTLENFLVIVGAFNNVETDAIVNALGSLNLGQNLVRFIELLPKSRIMTTKVWATICQRMVHRATPQGGVISPLFWNLAVNSLLRGLEHSGNDVIAYVCPQTLSYKFKLLRSIILVWCRDFGLSINPSKTDTILFIKTHKISDFFLPSICRTRVTLSPEVKYLGLILDTNLNWRANLAGRARKATCAAYCYSRWGLRRRSGSTLRSSNPTTCTMLLSGGLL